MNERALTSQARPGLGRARLVDTGFRGILGDTRGSSVIEFTLILPVLITVLFAIIAFGITLNNYIELASGVSASSRILSISRGATTPFTSTQAALTGAAANLDPARLTANFVITVNGTACTTDAACVTALKNASGLPATVTASYPCTLGLVNLQTGCNLFSQSTQAVE
jgi:Flp pilus assembly protein TadG